MMKLKILGSAASEGWPAIFCECEHCAKARELGGKNIRARASYLVNDKMLVDLGPDTYYHDSRYGYFTKDLEAFLITHTHADHFNANEFLNRCWGYMSKVTRPAVLAGSEAVFQVFEEMTKETLEVAMLEKLLLKVGEPAKAAGIEIFPLPAQHQGSLEGEQALNYVLSVGDRSILIANDTGWWEEEAWRLIPRFKLDCAVIDATFGMLNDHRGNHHMTCDYVVEFRDKLRELGALKDECVVVANHFSHNGGGTHDELIGYLSKYDIETGYDGMELIFD